jgi:hypothetical protein
MDYAKELSEVQKLISGGFYPQAVQTAGKILESLYTDLYHELLGRAPRREREEIIRRQQAARSGKAIDRFTLGDLARLFEDARLVPLLKRSIGRPFPLLETFIPDYFVNLRNRVTHEATYVTAEEAWWCYLQVYMLLKESGRTDLPGVVQHVQLSSARSRPRFSLAEDDWTCYTTSLSETLESEARTYRVPVDVIENSVVLYNRDPKQDQPKADSRPWLEVARNWGKGLLVLLGDPGEGKTVCLAGLAKSLVEDGSHDPATPIPVRVRLAFYDHEKHSLAALIADQFRLDGPDIPDDSVVPDVLSQRACFVLLDGLNEVPDHVAVIGELQTLMGQTRGTRYCLSCRKADYDRVRESLGSHEPWELRRFEPEEIQKFLEHCLRADVNRRKRLESWLEDERLAEVLSTPFFLSLAAALDPRERGLPENRAQLCQHFVDSFQERELKARPELRPAGNLWGILEKSAFYMQELAETHLPVAAFEELSQKIWFDQLFGDETSVPLDTVLQALYRSPFLSREFGKVTFAHQLFRDFFAANALVQQVNLSDEASFERFLREPQWEYTVILVAGLVDNPSQILNNILYEGTKYDLAIRCLREARRLDLLTMQRIIEWLRQGHQFWSLLGLPWLIAALSEEAEGWLIEETEAILKTILTSDQYLDGFLAAWQFVCTQSGWPASEDMILRAAQDGIESTHHIERGNSLFSLASQGHWEKLMSLLTDPSPYVRKMLALSVGRFGAKEGSPELMGVVTTLGQDSEVQVRCAAMEAAGTLADKGGASVLERGLSDSDANVRLAALRAIMAGHGEQYIQARSKAVILLQDLLESVFRDDDPPRELEEDPFEELVTKLAVLDSPESSDVLFEAAFSGTIRGTYVAEILADRGDPRALLALIDEMTCNPKGHLEEDLWNAEIEEKIAQGLAYPFKLAWFEALLIEEEAFQARGLYPLEMLPSGRVARLDLGTALEEMVEAAQASRDALAYYLWALLTAKGRYASGHGKDRLIEAAISRLIEVNPPVLVDFIIGTSQGLPEEWTELWTAKEFAKRLLKSAAALMDALPEKERQRLMGIPDAQQSRESAGPR